MISLALDIAALVLFILAAILSPSPRVNLGWAGMACLTLAQLVAGR